MDDDDEELFPTPQPMQVTTQWRLPSLVPLPPDVAAPQLESPETRVQNDRISFVRNAIYATTQDVPDSPQPLTDAEQALDMTSQASANVAKIPFFAPQQPVIADVSNIDFLAISQIPGIKMPQPSLESPATLEYVQSLGLPMYLVGQPVKTLKTLSESPSLLNTMVDAQGFYDRNQLMNLVHALNAPIASHVPSASQYQPPVSAYGAAPPMSAGLYGMPPVAQHLNIPSSGGFRVKTDEGNLHVIGYGPGTTERDLIAAFAPYVHVDEVVMKGTFSFVNTSDPVSAIRAKAALTGTLIGGMPIRINNATRKSKDFTTYGGGGDPAPSFAMAHPHHGIAAQPPPMFVPTIAVLQPTAPPQLAMPPPPQPEINVENARDDRGNPATKNLFVAGYGQGTTEQELRDLFSTYSEVTGVISKGNFSFVNTADRAAAVRARQALAGSMYNGGVLRINYAKETGRLGTSFDLTYGRNTGPNANRQESSAPAINQPVSYYGRGF
jgi:RNA recognition motif-containing protein